MAPTGRLPTGVVPFAALAALAILAVPGAAAAPAGLAAARPAPSQDRPLLYGSGYIYPAWKGFAGAQASRWESANLQLLQDAGAAATGASFNWVNMEPVQGGGYNWTETDSLVAATGAAGLGMIAYMGNTPDWALQAQHKGLGYRFPPQPQFNASFVRWVTAVAQRYRGKVSHYEFWNEQNGCGWINPGCANGNMAPR